MDPRISARRTLSSLDALEANSIHVIRELSAERERPVLLFSGGKDSLLLLHVAQKAFWPAPIPFPVLHVDTGHNFPEVIAIRDQRARELGLELIVASVEESIRRGRVEEERGPYATRNRLQTVTLLDSLKAHRFDAAFGGARRDEERARAKERVVSHRDAFGQWEPRNQRAELWRLYSAAVGPLEHLRVFPLSDWTELDVWRYIARERIQLPSIYYAHDRAVIERDGMLLSAGPYLELMPDEVPRMERVRFRTVGDMTCTGATVSDAGDDQAVIAEIVRARVTERGASRADDRTSAAAMERRKREGYF